MDNKRTLFDFNDRLIAGTPIIEVPNKMVFFTKAGKLKEVPTLTKSGIVSMRNKKRLIKFKTIDENSIFVKSKGETQNSLKNLKMINVANAFSLNNSKKIKLLQENIKQLNPRKKEDRLKIQELKDKLDELYFSNKTNYRTFEINRENFLFS